VTLTTTSPPNRGPTRQVIPHMKINKKLALTAIMPVAVAGTGLSGWVAVSAATSHEPHHRQVSAASHQAAGAAHRSARRRPGPGHPASIHRIGTHQHAPAKAGRHAGSAHAHQAAHRAVHRAGGQHPAATAAAPAAVSSAGSLLSGMSAFERCVAWHESGDNPTASSAGLFGILPSTWASLGLPGTAGGASVATQKAAFDRLYAQYGTQPWAPYDGC
jgi:hypothetical protein